MLLLYAPSHGAKTMLEAFGSYLLGKDCDYELIQEYSELKQKIGLVQDLIVLAGIPVNDHLQNYEVIEMLKEKHVRTFFILDHWHNDPRNFYDPDSSKFYLPEKIFCIDKSMQTRFIACGLDPKRIIPIGHPALEDTVNNKHSPERNAVIKKSLGIQKDIVSVFLDPIIGWHNIDFGYDELDVVKFLLRSTGRLSREFEFVIKCHPRTDPSLIRQVLHSAGNKNVQLLNESLVSSMDLLNISEKVLGMTTIMLIHALALGKPTASIQLNPTRPGRSRSNVHLDKILISREPNLIQFLEDRLAFTEKLNSCNFEGTCRKLYKAINLG